MTQLGKVKFYDETKKFGFVISDETKQEVFFFNKLSFNVGDLVIFETQQGKKGMEATSISKYEIESARFNPFGKVIPKKGRKCIESTSYVGTEHKTMHYKNLRTSTSKVIVWNGTRENADNLLFERGKILEKWNARKTALAVFCETKPSRTYIQQQGYGWDLYFMFKPEVDIYKVNEEAKKLGYFFLEGKIHKGYMDEVHISKQDKIGGEYNYQGCEKYFDITYIEEIEIRENYIFESTHVDYNNDHFDRGGSWTSLSGSTATTLEKATARIEKRTYNLIPKEGFEYLGLHTHKMSWARKA